MAKLKRALRTFDSASLTSSPQSVGAVVPFVVTKAAIINTSDVDVLIGDGSSDEDIRVPANGTVNIAEGHNVQGTNRTTDDCVFYKNVQLDITQVTGSGTGTIIINLLGIN